MIPGTLVKKTKIQDTVSVPSTAQLVLRNPWWVDTLIFVVLGLLGLITFLPLYMVLVRSFSPSHVINTTPLLLWPREWTLEAYNYILQTPVLQQSFLTTPCLSQWWVRRSTWYLR